MLEHTPLSPMAQEKEPERSFDVLSREERDVLLDRAFQHASTERLTSLLAELDVEARRLAEMMDALKADQAEKQADSDVQAKLENEWDELANTLERLVEKRLSLQTILKARRTAS